MQTQWIGYIAAICTTISFIPQVLHTFRTRDTRAISLGMYSILTFGVSMWLVYGLMIKDMPMIAANAVTLCLSFCILSYKVYQTFVKPPL